MIFLRSIKFFGLAGLMLVTPSLAQFGVAGNKRKTGASFQDLNEMAKEQQAGGGAAGYGAEDLVKMQEEMMANFYNNPEMMNAMKSMGEQMQSAMEELSKMDPEQLQKQMQDAMAMLTKGDVVESVLGQKDEILKNLEMSGLVPKDELEKYKRDPEYFEQQMRLSFGQMSDIFKDPDVVKTMSETMAAISDPDMQEFNKVIQEGLTNDDKLEEARLLLLSNQKLAENPIIAHMFEDETFNEVLKDAKKWRETFKEGQSKLRELALSNDLLGSSGVGRAGAGLGGMGAGAGMGEL